MKFEVGKKYKTRCGLDAEILKTDCKGKFPLAGIVAESDGFDRAVLWTDDGHYWEEDEISRLDLIGDEPQDEQVDSVNMVLDIVTLFRDVRNLSLSIAAGTLQHDYRNMNEQEILCRWYAVREMLQAVMYLIKRDKP